MSPQIQTVYIVHNSHTDIGYTHPQPVVWERHRRGIDQALELAWADRAKPADQAFRWTVETTAPLLHWLRYANDRQRERLLILNREGRIDIGGMFLNLTPLCDTAELIASLQPVNKLRKMGLTVRYAMNCDINGQNWPLSDILIDAGIAGYAMGVNEAWGRAPLYQPCPFWWESPGKRRLLVWNGWIYGYIGRTTGLNSHDADKFAAWWPRIEEYLNERHYPLPVLMIQASGDNILPDAGLSGFVTAWNAAGRTPRLRMSTLSEWMDVLHGHAAGLPLLRGDWTDYWNFGCISSAREQGIQRESRTRLQVAYSLRAIANATDNAQAKCEDAMEEARRHFGPAALYEQALNALLVYDEHTWGASVSVREPESEEARMQWAHKAAYAAEARSISMMLQQDGLAWLAGHVNASVRPAYLVFNPLPWERKLAGPVSASPDAEWTEPTTIPGFGYKLVPAHEHGSPETSVLDANAIVENHRHRIIFDHNHGGIKSWWDKELSRELVDTNAGLSLAGFVHEEVADRQHVWPRQLIWSAPANPHPLAQSRDGWHSGWQARRTQPTQLISHQVTTSPWGVEVVQEMVVPCLPTTMRLHVRLPNHDDYIECLATWAMGQETHPEATYLTFPFAVPQAECMLDLGPQAMKPERDQLPGVCRDYFTVQRWVDFSSNDFGITVACPLNPMVQLGGFRFGLGQERFTLEKPLLLGWITNNYWGTNFRAHQPGEVSAHYRLLPHRGPFNEEQAHRFGLESASPCLFIKANPSAKAQVLWPEQGALLHLPAPPVIVLSVQPGEEPDVVLVSLIQSSDEPGQARLAPGILRFACAMRCDIFGNPQEELPLNAGVCELQLQPRTMVTIRLEGVSCYL